MCCEMIRAKKNRRVRADAADSNSPVCIRNVLPGVPTLLCSLPHSDQLKKTNDNWLQGLISLLFFASCDPAPENECLFSFSGPYTNFVRIAKEQFPYKAKGVPKRIPGIRRRHCCEKAPRWWRFFKWQVDSFRRSGPVDRG